jgi:hypothetical protein
MRTDAERSPDTSALEAREDELSAEPAALPARVIGYMAT